MRSATISSGSAIPTEALAPYTSASRNTEIIDTPPKPAFETPMHSAATSASIRPSGEPLTHPAWDERPRDKSAKGRFPPCG